MPDDFAAEIQPAPYPSAPYPSVGRRGGAGVILLGMVVAFLLGAAGVTYALWEGIIPLPRRGAQPLAAPAPAAPPAAAGRPAAAVAAPDQASLAGQQAQLEARAAALAARLDALTVTAQSAADNAGRAEALLVAFAARRTLDRGTPLDSLEDQLRLRFGDSQPHAVTTVIEAARQPVTLDQLVAGLDSLAPSLTQAPAEASAWARLRHEVAGLFVIRREATPSPAPESLLGHARILVESGRIGEAIDEVRRLPGAGDATDWFTAARRYDDARRALDVLETAALIGRPPAAARTGQPPAPQASAAPAV